MAKEITMKIICTECGHENEVTVYAGLNAQVDTDKYVELLNGSLFNFDCAGCGKKGHLNYDMIYHDIVHRAIIHYAVSEDSVKKAKASIEALAKKAGELGGNYDNSTMFLSHGDCREDAEYLAKLLKEKYGVKEVFISYVGSVIGSHSGPGTLALFFLGDHR